MGELIGTPNIAVQLNDDSLTLEQKLELIDQAMAEREAENRETAERLGIPYVPRDPMEGLGCVGCQ